MCGIFGILSMSQNLDIYHIIINGLIQLQNRGYDSSGISILKNNDFITHKYASTNEITSIDKLLSLKLNDPLNDMEIVDSVNTLIGIGHNRWATHGGKTDINAHPHISNNKEIILVHNGIIENYMELKKFLIQKGFIFYSQTDTEIIVNLISYYLNHVDSGVHNMISAIKKTINDLQGTYGIIIMNKNEKHKLYCVRNGSPLLVGSNGESVIITSEQSGFCNLVNTYITLNNDDICVIERKLDDDINNNITINTSNTYIEKKVNLISYELNPAPYKHWTIKEIFEQPDTIFNSINRGGRIKDNKNVKLGGLEQNIHNLIDVDNLILLGCGTSYHAGLYGMVYLKSLCNFNVVQVFDGADFNFGDIPKIGKSAIVLISQSGETKDLHRCIDIAKENNIITIGIINVVDSLIAREVDCGIYCNAGREIGVASTKAYTSQVICLSMMAIWFAQIKNINEYKRKNMIKDLQNLSNDFKNTLENVHDKIKTLSLEYLQYSNLFILGKGSDESIAREGSLKIKEISYIHSEAYSASSLKHGPFALLDERFPVIILNCNEEHNAKIMNCYEEVKSRNSPILFITNNLNIGNNINKYISVSKNSSYSSLLGLIPLQLFAYYLSVNKGINPDIPKNLAKVVTVE
jgi:glucosamine--fructose-6-phosphate aminotransferase (isomerizing)